MTAGTAAGVRTVAAFDFDGTLTHHDTLVPFLMHVRGRPAVLRALLATAPALARAPLNDAARHRAKEALLVATLRGWWIEELQPLADEFAARVVEEELRPDRVARLRWHQEQGHDVVIVSASPELYVAAAGTLLGCAATLATRLEVDRRGRLTGRIFDGNVRAALKERRLRDWLGPNPVHLWAYGDSDGDAEMLAMADIAARLRGGEKLTPEP